MSSPSTPHLKLTYFNDNKGRNELVRLILEVGKVAYEDELIGNTEYMRLRDNDDLPYGQLPIMTVDSKAYGQSCALARYAAKLASLYPADYEEALLVDGVLDGWRDTLDLFYAVVFDRRVIGGKLTMFPHPSAQRYAKLSEFVSTELTEQFRRFDELLKKDNCAVLEGVFPTCADLAIYDLVKTMEGVLEPHVFEKLVEPRPSLRGMVSKIDAIPEIQQHLEKHPYKNIRHFFVKNVAIWQQFLEFLLFPILQLIFAVLSFFRRYTIRTKVQKGSE